MEQLVTIPAKSSDVITLGFSLPASRWDLIIIPLNRAARNNPLKVLSSDVNGVQLSHEIAPKRKTKYKVKVMYK